MSKRRPRPELVEMAGEAFAEAMDRPPGSGPGIKGRKFVEAILDEAMEETPDD